MLGLLVSELDATMFATAMPTIVGDLGGLSLMPWVTTSYVVAATVVMPIYGRLGDVVGRRRMLIAALSVFLVGSVIGGFSVGMAQLIAARAVQGLGAGGLLVLVQAVVAEFVPARRRAPYLSAMGAVFAVAAAAGPVLGGWLADGIGWRWAFWLTLPLAGFAILLAVLLRPRERAGYGPIRLDIEGMAALAIGVAAVVALTSWAGTRYPWWSPVIVSLGVVALTAAVVFVLVERRAIEPIIDLGLFRHRNFALVTAAALLGALPIFGVATYLPTYLQMVVGLTATTAGMVMLCMIAGIGSAVVVCAQIVSRTGHYKWLPVGGCGAVAVALLVLTTLDATTGLPAIGLTLFLFGCGMGCVVELLVLVAQNSTPAAKVGTVTAVHQFGRELGASLGIALVGSVFVARLGRSVIAISSGNGAAGSELPGVGPVELGHLTAPVRATVVAAYDAALTSSFLVVLPFAVISAVLLAFVRPEPMRTTLPAADSDEPADSSQLVPRSAS